MNRSFIAQLTPSRARLLCNIQRYNNIELDPYIAEVGEKDRVKADIFDHYGISSNDEQRAVQFMVDMNYRAGLPLTAERMPRAGVLIAAAFAAGGITDCVGPISIPELPVDVIAMQNGTSLIQHRNRVMVADIDGLTNYPISGEMLGRLFPRIILYGTQAIQYAFSYGSAYSSTSRIGKILFPQVEETFNRANYKRNTPKAMVAMGVFPDLIDTKNNHIARSFVKGASMKY